MYFTISHVSLRAPHLSLNDNVGIRLGSDNSLITRRYESIAHVLAIQRLVLYFVRTLITSTFTAIDMPGPY